MENKADILVHLVVESLSMFMLTESKPEYLLLKLGVKNLYLRDFNTPKSDFPFVIQTIIPNPGRGDAQSSMNFYSKSSHVTHEDHSPISPSDFINAMDIEFEVNPRHNFGMKRLKCHTHGQLYIYLNLEFARRLVEFTGRILQVMESNYSHMVEQAPPVIRVEIDKGSYYQDVIDKMIQNKEEQIKSQIDKYK